LGHVGLAISITAASVVQLTGLLLLLRHRAGPLGFRALVRPVASMLVAALASGVAMALVASLGRWREGGNVPLNVAVLALALVVGGGAYAAVAYFLRVPELLSLTRAVRRRLARR